MKYDYKLLCRLDDDIILEPNYIEELVKGISKGYDLMGGITTPYGAPENIRDIKFVEPIIGYCEFNKDGELTANFDDCGHLYNDKKIILAPHFRSCALYKRELHENGVDYSNKLSRNGFREEQIFSFKAILKGFKLGVNTGAINWHLLTPSGGERDSMNMVEFNQGQFNTWCKEVYQEKGDFLQDYYKRNNVEKKLEPDEYLKQNNLITRK
jgi:hypothetical protein